MSSKSAGPVQLPKGSGTELEFLNDGREKGKGKIEISYCIMLCGKWKQTMTLDMQFDHNYIMPTNQKIALKK